jgi:hypothetical protein
MLARESVTVARSIARAGRILLPNSSLDGQPGSIWEPYPTDGNTHGLRMGVPRGYILMDTQVFSVLTTKDRSRI